MDHNNADNLINILALSFFKGVCYHFKPEDINLMNWESQESFLKQTVKSTLFKKYPCSRNYCKKFFKIIIQYLECKQEVHDDIYGFLCTVMNNSENEFSYHHYVINNDLKNIIIIKETKNMVVNGTTGLKTWEAALMLTDWSLGHKEVFSNKNILEIGSGVGFTGITITKQCNIKSMIMTDCHSEVLKTIDDNIGINFSEVTTKEIANGIISINNEKYIGAMMLDWNNIEDFSLHYMPDIVLGADIVYDPTILLPLINVLKYISKMNNNVDIYIASVIRNQDTFGEFLKTLDMFNFKYEEIKLTNNGYIDWDNSNNRCFLKINKI